MASNDVVVLPEVVVPARPSAPAAPSRIPQPSQFVATIRAAGRIYSAWSSVTVRRDINDGISVFSFVAAEGAYGPNYQELKLQPFDPVEIWLNDEKVIQGSVTNRSVAFDANSHQVVISGKSITDVLVKSSVPIKPGSYDGSTIEQAVRAVLAPHKIGLVIQNPSPIVATPFNRLAAQYGEKCSEFIDRLCRVRELFVCDDANGNLVLSQGDPSAAPVAMLVEGRNIVSLSGSLENSAAFGKIAGTSQTSGSDSNYPPRDASASATNPALPSEHLDLFISPEPLSSQELAAAVNRRVANSVLTQVNIAVVVVGWFQPNGQLWQPMQNVSLYSPMLFPDATNPPKLGIQSIVWSQDANGGSSTTLNIVLPNALSHRPLSDVPDASGNSFVGTASKTSTGSAVPDPSDTVLPGAPAN